MAVWGYQGHPDGTYRNTIHSMVLTLCGSNTARSFSFIFIATNFYNQKMVYIRANHIHNAGYLHV